MLIQSDEKVYLLWCHIKVSFVEQIEKLLMTRGLNSVFSLILRVSIALA